MMRPNASRPAWSRTGRITVSGGGAPRRPAPGVKTMPGVSVIWKKPASRSSASSAASAWARVHTVNGSPGPRNQRSVAARTTAADTVPVTIAMLVTTDPSGDPHRTTPSHSTIQPSTVARAISRYISTMLRSISASIVARSMFARLSGCELPQLPRCEHPEERRTAGREELFEPERDHAPLAQREHRPAGRAGEQQCGQRAQGGLVADEHEARVARERA